MARGVCSPEQRANCPLFDHFSDNDHIVPQRYRKVSWLLNKYISTPDNQQQLCRWEHEQKTESAAELLENCQPEESFMVDAVRRAYEAGKVPMNRQDLTRLHNYELRGETA